MKNYVIDLLLNELENYEGAKVYACELAYTLLECYNIDGSITYSSYDAKEWIRENYNDIGAFLENYNLYMGSDSLSNLAIDIFTNPEKAMVIIVYEVAMDILSELKFIKDNWDNEINLNTKNISKIEKGLKELKEND